MKFEDLQKTWQSKDANAKVTINTDMLLKEVRHNQQQFRAMILWRDVREVGVAFLLTLFFLHQGMRHHDWTDYLLAFAGFGVGNFMVVDRLIQRRKQPVANDSLKSCIESSLLQVNHQIWLLKNVFWWYLLPVLVGLGILIVSQIWKSRHDGPFGIIFLTGYALFCALFFWGVYWFNQYAVRKGLEPRRQELESLLAGLDK